MGLCRCTTEPQFTTIELEETLKESMLWLLVRLAPWVTCEKIQVFGRMRSEGVQNERR
jgi:hypothetical protein